MRIGIDIKAFKNSTGIARYLRNVMDNLQKIDHENEYFLFRCRPFEYHIENANWQFADSFTRLPGIVWQQFVLPGVLEKYGIDILWAPEQIAPCFKKGAKRTITTIHDLTHIHYPYTVQKINFTIQKYLLPEVIKQSDRIVVYSDYIKDDVYSNFGHILDQNNVIKIPLGKPEDWNLPDDYSADKRKDYLLFAGNMEPRKNLINLIKAMEIMSNKFGINPELHIAGPAGWRNRELRKYMDTSIVKDKVKILGFVTDNELQKEYAECRALVYPSVYEGFGLPVLEGLMMDCVVCTSENTVMQEVAEDCAVFFNPHDPQDIAGKLRNIYSEEFNRGRFLEKKEKVLCKYSWRGNAVKMFELFTRVQ